MELSADIVLLALPACRVAQVEIVKGKPRAFAVHCRARGLHPGNERAPFLLPTADYFTTKVQY